MTIQSRAARLLQSAFLVAAVLQSPGVFALSPDLRLSQLYHTTWTAQDGGPTGIESLAQTSDGYIWLAACAGLFRFDGVRFERIDNLGGQRLPSNNVLKLFPPRSGGLWIGYRLGAGTEFDLRVPADVAYRRLQTQSRGIRTWLGLLRSSAQEQ